MEFHGMPGLVDKGEIVSFDLSISLLTLWAERHMHSHQGQSAFNRARWCSAQTCLSASCPPADNAELSKTWGTGPECGEPDNCCFLFCFSLSYTLSGSTATSSVLILQCLLQLCSVEFCCFSLATVSTAAQLECDVLAVSGASLLPTAGTACV